MTKYCALCKKGTGETLEPWGEAVARDRGYSNGLRRYYSAQAWAHPSCAEAETKRHAERLAEYDAETRAHLEAISALMAQREQSK